MKNKSLILLTALFIMGAGYFFYARSGAVEVNEEMNNTEMTVNESDSMESETSDQELIKQALVTKRSWDSEEIILSVDESDGEYATGSVKNRNEMGGGRWFAAKVDGEWEIVWDGNGTVTCDDLVSYPNYPISLIPDCYDVQSGGMVAR